MSNLVDDNEANVRSRASSCALQLYKYLFDWAVKNEKLSLVTNAILVQLRLIKVCNYVSNSAVDTFNFNNLILTQAEDKNTLIECCTSTCVGVLRKAVLEANIIPKSSIDMINLFLEKRKPSS